ncbi:MAG TPA: nuclear transport factor 2 family protein [Acidobacteriota bacterium]|nr:nuclear transport factor 2 family protein [Acidobacteriota bacterium]
MKPAMSILLTSLLLALLLSSACQQEVDISAETFAVKAVMEQYFAAAKEKSMDKLTEVAGDPELTFVTPYSGENFDGWEAFKAHVEEYFGDETFKFNNYVIKDHKVRISPLGDAAWCSTLIAEEFEFQGSSFYWDLECTSVLEKREGIWKIALMHFSFPRAGEEALAKYRATIEANNAAISEAVAAGNVDAMVAFYTVDAALMPPNSEILKGTDLITATMQGMVNQGTKGLVLTTTEISDAGEFICEIGRYDMRIQPRGRRATTEVGKYLVMWQPQPDGSLKIALDMWNTSPAVR